MSKSLHNCIYLDDLPDEITRKVMLLTTDPTKVRKDDPGDPDICSVMAYHKAGGDIDGADIADAACRTGRLGCVEHKRTLSHHIATMLSGYRASFAEFLSDPEGTLSLLKDGSERARTIAAETMREVRELAGYGL
jgi:tryptophanyl-tRNA synthetase